jgi:ribA/ribD-fused uncharacterized protein
MKTKSQLTVPENIIRFYSVSKEYGEFSNFAPYEIIVEHKIWPTSEHYFQAMKFDDANYRERIRKCKNPSIAAKLGRDRTIKIRRDWNSVRINIMEVAVMAKFTQHEHLKQLLLSTGQSQIIEHTENDDFWGDGGNGKGQNMLGRILMCIREKIRTDKF